MYQEKKILAVIPARGGSKGIPNKNIIDVCGKPLLAYSIETALACPYIDDVCISTDSEKIAQTAKDWGGWVPFLRPAALATDTAKTIDCLVYTVNRLKELGKTYDYLVLLQPTQPLRKVSFLKESITQVIDNGYPSLVSVCPVKEHPILMRTISSDGTLNPLLSMGSTVRRQDFPAYYKVNGSIYINKLDETFTAATSLNDNLYPYVMEQAYSLDIDSYEDLELVKQYILNQKETGDNL